MKSRFRKCIGICLRTGVLGLLLSAWTVGLVAAESRPLRILLTNDDGYDAPGLRVLRDTLLAEGHDVTVVAPLQNRSGSGIRVSIGGTIDVQEQGEGIWSVDGFPADSVLVGLQEYFADEAPDLVVSGANFGPNLGFAGSSGTVGAATMAANIGVPAIAVSVGINPAEQDQTPIPFPSTFKAFAGAAELTSTLISDLQKNRSGEDELLPVGTILNINYPPLTPDALRGVRVSPATWDVGVRIDYLETDEAGRLDVALRVLEPGAPSDSDADWQWFARGYATITILDDRTDAGESLRKVIAGKLSITVAN